MIVSCPSCDSRYDVSGRAPGTRARCRCGTVFELKAPPVEAGLLACPRCGGGVPPTDHRCPFCSTELLLKACPRCMARVFHGHRHCPACGARAHGVATAEFEKQRPCPRCEVALVPRLLDDLAVDDCPECGGVFLDATTIERVISERQQARAEAILGAYDAGAPFDGRQGGPMYVKCPECAVVMNRRQFAHGARVIVDVCRSHGTWFDAGELPRVVAFVMNGGLERAAKVELERAHDEAKKVRQDARYAQIQAARFPAEPRREGVALVDLLTSLWR